MGFRMPVAADRTGVCPIMEDETLESELQTLEAAIDRNDPARLAIDIRLIGTRTLGDQADPGLLVLRQVIRDELRSEFRHLLDGVERRAHGPAQRPRSRSWLGRVVAFVVSAAIGSAATLLISASHVRPPDAAFALMPRLADPGLAAIEARKPGSQSSAVPAPSGAASAQAAAGPATFGLNEQ
jgi:hypothetical protein